MRRNLIAVILGSLLTAGVAVAQKATTLTCTLTNKTVEKCCCITQKDGKLYCTLAKKTIDACCCKETPKP